MRRNENSRRWPPSSLLSSLLASFAFSLPFGNTGRGGFLFHMGFLIRVLGYGQAPHVQPHCVFSVFLASLAAKHCLFSVFLLAVVATDSDFAAFQRRTDRQRQTQRQMDRQRQRQLSVAISAPGGGSSWRSALEIGIGASFSCCHGGVQRGD